MAGLERWALLILRLWLGFVFVMHGSQKLMGAFGGAGVKGTAAFFAKYGLEPSLPLAWVVTVTEFFGGICIFLGLLTRFWAAGLVIDMTVAVLKVHVPNGFFWGKSGFEFPLTLGILALVVLLSGPGMMALDRMIRLERRY